MPKQKKEATSTPVVLLVGNKPSMNYCLYVANQLLDAKVIIVKARGKSISKAVDVVEILRRRFIKDLKVTKIEIDTVEVDDKERNLKRRISSIEITFQK